MKKILFTTILLCGVFTLAGLEELVQAGAIDSTFPNGTSRDTMLINTRVGVDPPAFAVVSSYFEDDVLGGFHTAGADDFTVPDCGWEINTIRAYGSYSDPVMTGNTGPATSVNVYILPKTGATPTSTNLAGTAIYAGEGLSYTELDPVNGGDFEIAVPGWVLPAGDYWVVVQANIELFAVGQWNWTESSLTPNSGTTYGDESAWFQSSAGVASPVTGTATCVGAWNARVTGCSMTRNPDTNPPADRDFAFQIEGNILPAGVTVSETTLTTTENGSTVTYTVVLDSPPTPGETVTVTPSSNDVTEGTVSGALNFIGANWDVPQLVTITPGAAGDGNDGDVAYTIDNNVSSAPGGGCYDAVIAASVGVTNLNIEGIATIIVSPSSGISVTEDGTVTQIVTFSAGPDVAPSADVTVDLTNPNPTLVSLSAASVVLTAGNGYSSTVTITGVADDVKEAPAAFSITTEPAVSGDVSYSGVDPTNITGTLLDSNTVAVTVTPSAVPLSTNEAGATATVSYVLTAQPTANVTFTLSVDDPAEASVAPSVLTFTNANWNVPQVVTVTGEDDDIDDGLTAYNVTSTVTTSTDPFWNAVPVASVAGENADDADTAGFTVNDGGGISTTEAGTTDTFTVVLNSEPVFSVSIDITSGDTSEGLVGPVGGPYVTTRTLTFTAANWNTPQTVEVQGQPDAVRADGDINYTIFTENVVSGDPLYNGMAVPDVAAVNIDIDGPVGITADPLTLTILEDGVAQTFTVVLDTMPTADATMAVFSNDTTEATVAPPSLTFTTANWNVPQMVTVTPVLDGIVDADQTFNVDLGPVTGGGNYLGLTAAVSVTIENVDTCEPMTLDADIGDTIIACGSAGCVFDLYNCTDGTPGTYIGTFVVDAGGCVDTGVVAQQDTCYLTTITQTNIILTNIPFFTVPTLGEWGLITFTVLLMGLALVIARRRIK